MNILRQDELQFFPMIHKRTQCTGFLAGTLAFLLTLQCVRGEDHLTLKNDAAVNYYDARSHLRLANYHLAQGHLEMAFMISEFARSLFDEGEFNAAFSEVIRARLKVPGHEFSSEEEMNAFCIKNPNSQEAQVALALKGKNVGTTLRRLRDKYPDSASIASALARYELKVEKNYSDALTGYFEVYFVDPHHYDGEYVEFRIKEMLDRIRKKRWSADKRNIIDKVRDEKMPVSSSYGVECMAKKYSAATKSALFAALESDDTVIQSMALQVLMEHKRDISEDELNSLLKHPAFAVQAMAILLGADRLPKAVLVNGFSSRVQLIQVDAFGAASLLGSDGVDLLRNNAPKDMHPGVKKAYDHYISAGKTP